MLLGAIMAELRDESLAAAALLSLGDLPLVAAVESARLRHQEGVGEYVSGAARRFARAAADEDWLRLMTALERSDHPAAACLTTMVRWSLDVEAREGGEGAESGGCSCGGGGCREDGQGPVVS